jgi:hypothetical protein
VSTHIQLRYVSNASPAVASSNSQHCQVENTCNLLACCQRSASAFHRVCVLSGRQAKQAWTTCLLLMLLNNTRTNWQCGGSSNGHLQPLLSTLHDTRLLPSATHVGLVHAQHSANASAGCSRARAKTSAHTCMSLPLAIVTAGVPERKATPTQDACAEAARLAGHHMHAHNTCATGTRPGHHTQQLEKEALPILVPSVTVTARTRRPLTALACVCRQKRKKRL